MLEDYLYLYKSRFEELSQKELPVYRTIIGDTYIQRLLMIYISTDTKQVKQQ